MLDRRLQVQSTRWVAQYAFVLSFRCPEIAAAALPGQFVMISVSDTIDPLLRRPMAFYAVGEEDGAPTRFSLLVEVMGRGTRLLSQLSAGDAVDVLGPIGQPFVFPKKSLVAGDDPDESPTEHIFVMGGVGSVPFPFLAERMQLAGCTMSAFIGGRTAEHLLCAEDFESLEVPVTRSTDDGSVGHHGLVTAPLVTHLENLRARGGRARLYSCGPTPMMHAVDRLALEYGLPHQVSLEAPMACGIGVCLSCVVPAHTRLAGTASATAGRPHVDAADGYGRSWSYRRICREGPVFDTRYLLWEGRR